MDPAPPRSSLPSPPDAAGLVAALDRLRAALPDWLRARRWFRNKGRTVAHLTLADAAALPLAVAEPAAAALTLVEVTYADGAGETYLLPLAARPAAAAQGLLPPDAAVLARLGAPDGDWLLYDGLDDPAVGVALLRRVESAGDLAGRHGAFGFDRTPVLSQATGGAYPLPVSRLRRLRGEQSNTSVVYDDRLVLKVFRCPEPGESPDLEIGRFLTLRARFPHVPQLGGFARYTGPAGERTIALLTTFVPNEGDGWSWTLAALRRFFAAAPPGAASPAGAGEAAGRAGGYLTAARRLGEVTGELHGALAGEPGDPAFAPEPVAPADLAAWGAAVEARVARALDELAGARSRGVPSPADADRVLAGARDAAVRIRAAVDRLAGVPLWKIRGHGDYHLGQVLRVAGPEDRFVVIDFEGEPARPLAERRGKHSPLRDVAGMLRSFSYASWAGLAEAAGGDASRSAALEPWRAGWESAAVDAFLHGYLAATVERGMPVVPAPPDVRALLLSLFSLEKAAYEVSYEINNRPTWLPIPLAAFARELAA